MKTKNTVRLALKCNAGVFWKPDTVSVKKSFPFFLPFVLVKKTLEKAKKLFKVSLLSLLKDSLVNCFWENLSFCQIVFGTDTFQKLTLGVPERLLGTVCVLKFRSV